MSQNRFMIAAPTSGSGKTLVTCGILQALVNRKLKVASFKCGPDYIDPMFHARVIGTKSRNLDCFFCDDETLKYLYARNAESSDISVIEGVMGFYDGMCAASTDGSSYDVSQKLKTPVILLVNCKGASVSCIPVVKGFKEFTENNIKGVILNNMSPHVFAEIKPAIERDLGLKVIGYVPKLKDINLESRHLGLVLPDEVASLKEDLNKLAGILEETLDFDVLLEIAAGAPEIGGKAPAHSVLDSKVKIGLAVDDTFCFTYEDNIELLKECGADIVPFSPMHDPKLPEGIHGMILSGGLRAVCRVSPSVAGSCTSMRRWRTLRERCAAWSAPSRARYATRASWHVSVMSHYLRKGIPSCPPEGSEDTSSITGTAPIAASPGRP